MLVILSTSLQSARAQGIKTAKPAFNFAVLQVIQSRAFSHNIPSAAESKLPDYKGRFKEWLKFNPEELCDKTSEFPECKPGIYQLGRKELPKGWILYINGIRNTYEYAHKSAVMISDAAEGHNVHSVFVPTSGLYLDLKRTHAELFQKAITPSVKMFVELARNLHQADSQKQFLVVAHSGGAIDLRNASGLLPEHIRKQMTVLAVAPGGYLQSDMFKEVVHLRSWDIVPLLDIVGFQRETKTTIQLDPSPEVEASKSYAAIDHDVLSPTFKPHIYERARSFVQATL